jgi:hypothetical protein
MVESPAFAGRTLAPHASVRPAKIMRDYSTTGHNM